ncbi:class I SAM-dependent methyltransferase [Luteolibacter yonseiensis]|uniref:Class I SAM-dependent methyltransferase n=1 Tax=Luteolibacter yonseiensis TaxID=1144680 RepID=A0A934VAP1_9BACT|nr:class I SAM-dependent methyltransferase [Luteolibacter yonseiensis]MBK1816398.1 class I SAM-dependent methyltransferase [Luteolibacter yonseiensis]
MNERGRWQGMWTIVRFNWPIYVTALAVMLVAAYGCLASGHLQLEIACGVVMAGSLYFLAGSLGVSHWVYDRSDLYRWSWLVRAMRGAGMERIIFCHSGFDEASGQLRQRFTGTRWTVLDHYDKSRMTEASIRRAREAHPPTPDNLTAPYDRWPVDGGSADVVMGLLAIHELRSKDERIAWFAEAGRCLRSGGRVILAEHTRDLANFVAFGPGFLHFHSAASWRTCWQRAGLHVTDEFRVTPWVKVFVITKP